MGAKTRYHRDGTWTKKRKKAIFARSFIKKATSITASFREIGNYHGKVHDNRVDLSIEGEVVIRDRGYFGVPARGDGFTMVRRITDAPLGELDKERKD